MRHDKQTGFLPSWARPAVNQVLICGLYVGTLLIGSARADTFIIGGFDQARGGVFSVEEGVYLDQARTSLAAHFPGTTLLSSSELTSDFLQNIDVLFVSSAISHHDSIQPLSEAEQDSLRQFVVNGGCAIVIPDNSTFSGQAPLANESLIDPFQLDINGTLGFATADVINPSQSLVTGGPFGEVIAFEQGYPGGLTELGPYAVSLAVNALGSALAVIEPHALQPGSGSVVIFSDVNSFEDGDIWAGFFPENESLFLNTIFYSLQAARPPNADAGADQIAFPGQLVTLDGSASTDPGEDYPLTYSWNVMSWPEGSECAGWTQSSSSPTTEFTPDMPGDFTIELVVTDNFGFESRPDVIVISANNTRPTADAGDDQVLYMAPTSVLLDGRGSWDNEGDAITYLWTILEKPVGSSAELNNPTLDSPTFEADIAGEFTIRLVVTDLYGAESDPDDVVVSYENVVPVADAQGTQAAVVGDVVFLDGSGSYDVNLDPLTYAWSLVATPPGSLAEIGDPAAMQTQFVPDMAGQYVVSLVVNDGSVDSEPSTLGIQVSSAYDELIGLLHGLIDAVNSLPDDSLKNAKMKKPLVNKINAVIAMVEAGQYGEALDKMENDIRLKTNGCDEVGAPDKNDWVTTCESQAQVYPLIVEIMAVLLIVSQP